ncbi:MAG: hypothetical protein ABWZ66_13460 [Pyrinomonadaceae bacterium]
MKPNDETEKATLVFVYNADSGVFSLLGDFAHKIFSPQTYACNLCAITHGNFGMKNEWREYIKTLPVPFEFLHADEFKAKYKIERAELPAVFRHQNGKVEEIIDAVAINDCRNIDDLKYIINQQINQL